MITTASPCTETQTVLGEGVRWDDRRNELLLVDILTGSLFRYRVEPATTLTAVARHEIGRPLGAVAPVEGDDGWVLAAGRGFARLGPDGRLAVVAEPAPENFRVNDAAADPAGRFWAGVMAEDQRAGAGTVHVLAIDGTVTQALDGLTIPNGIDWSRDGRTMYLADSGQGLVFSFEFDADSGQLGKRRSLIEFGGEPGVGDGLTVDAGGDLWIALYGGGEVRRYSPDGRHKATVKVPAPQATSPGFGGPGLSTLFVATATEGYTDEQREAEPLSGRLFCARGIKANGLPARRFQPRGEWWPR